MVSSRAPAGARRVLWRGDFPGMAGQTTMNGSAGSDHRPSGVIDSVNALGTNLGNLATLQMRLAVCDTRESLQRLTPSLILGAFAVIVMPASVVIGLFGAGYWLA